MGRLEERLSAFFLVLVLPLSHFAGFLLPGLAFALYTGHFSGSLSLT